ncbi:hypothetical protein GHA54_14310, partial [Enterococcus faecium]|nr:hypothetical protein [Enterococcus faecium]
SLLCPLCLFSQFYTKIDFLENFATEPESQNDELTNHLRETFKESANDLKIELDTWLLGLDVTEK